MRRYTFRGRCKATGEDVLGGITYVGDSAYIVQGIRTFIEVEPESVVPLHETDTDLNVRKVKYSDIEIMGD